MHEGRAEIVPFKSLGLKDVIPHSAPLTASSWARLIPVPHCRSSSPAGSAALVDPLLAPVLVDPLLAPVVPDKQDSKSLNKQHF